MSDIMRKLILLLLISFPVSVVAQMEIKSHWIVNTNAKRFTLHNAGDSLMSVRSDSVIFFKPTNKTLTNTATLDFPSTAAGIAADLTITVTGAALGDAVALGVPNGSVTATSTFTAWVSATDTVTVRFIPHATEDPASGSFRASVIKY